MRLKQNGFTDAYIVIAIVLVLLVGGLAFWQIGNSDDTESDTSNASISEVSEDRTTDMSEIEAVDEDESNQVVVPSTEEEAVVASYPKVAIPEDCTNYVHDSSGQAASSYEQVVNGVIGEWIGCVTTPWTDPYLISFEFKDDGTYSATQLSNNNRPALYYGTDMDHPSKVYSIDDFQDNGESVGIMDIYFDVGTNTTGNIRRMKLTGNTLQFEYMHRGQYGPVLYEFVRVNQT